MKKKRKEEKKVSWHLILFNLKIKDNFIHQKVKQKTNFRKQINFDKVFGLYIFIYIV